MGVQMGENIPLKSNDLECIFNPNIGDYGYKKINQYKTLNAEAASDRLEETYRTDLRRQRDKILYTGGFRRLQDKTQVISATREGDHRTRLTHTLEVEQIAISIANALKLNVDLVSAIALGHDVGHTPFGHAAERTLSNLLEDNGRFHHPIQSVRYLWEKYGSKIDWVIYEGILLHDSDMFKIKKTDVWDQFNYLMKADNESLEFKDWVKFDEWLNEFPSTLEAQVVIWADKIAYITHDLEDFLSCPAYVNLKKNNVKIEKDLCIILNELITSKKIESLNYYKPRDLIRNIINDLITSSVETINKFKNLQQVDVKAETKKRAPDCHDSRDNKMYLNSLIINFSDTYRHSYYKLREFLDDYYILSPEVQRSDAKAEFIVDWLFKRLSNKHELLPLKIRNEIDIAIIEEAFNNKFLGEIVQSLYGTLPKNQWRLSQLKKKIEDLNPKKVKLIKTDESLAYNDIKDKVVARKVACYIATMSDSYAEGMYRNLIGSSVDFNL